MYTSGESLVIDTFGPPDLESKINLKTKVDRSPSQHCLAPASSEYQKVPVNPAPVAQVGNCEETVQSRL
jgi:hypothetical protein